MTAMSGWWVRMQQMASISHLYYKPKDPTGPSIAVGQHRQTSGIHPHTASPTRLPRETGKYIDRPLYRRQTRLIRIIIHRCVTNFLLSTTLQKLSIDRDCSKFWSHTYCLLFMVHSINGTIDSLTTDLVLDVWYVQHFATMSLCCQVISPLWYLLL